MWAKLKATRQNLQPILTGWMVIALLLPVLLGVLPSAQAASTAKILQSVDLQLCSHLGHSDDGKGQPSQHDHDCPCCLPAGAGLVALPPLDAISVEQPRLREVAVFVLRTTAQIYEQTHFIKAYARGPPQFLNI